MEDGPRVALSPEAQGREGVLRAPSLPAPLCRDQAGKFPGGRGAQGATLPKPPGARGPARLTSAGPADPRRSAPAAPGRPPGLARPHHPGAAAPPPGGGVLFSVLGLPAAPRPRCRPVEGAWATGMGGGS